MRMGFLSDDDDQEYDYKRLRKDLANDYGARREGYNLNKYKK